MSNQEATYTWKPDEVFDLSGKELENLINLVNYKLSTPEAKEIIAYYELGKSLDAKVVDGIRDGKIKRGSNEEAP